jgi:SAM-dependent methyltransferase
VITQNYREFYEDPSVWDHFDRWHRLTRRRIRNVIHRLVEGLISPRVANVGSGGESYGLRADGHIHVDVIIGLLPHHNSVAADILLLPIASSSIDIAVCVGSVINHVDAAVAIAELIRIVRPGGRLILEFDSTDGLNYLFSRESGRAAAVANTFYNGRSIAITEYSRRYIEALLNAGGVQVDGVFSFHIISAAALALNIPPVLASFFAHFDWLADHFSPLRLRGSNVVVSGTRS